MLWWFGQRNSPKKGYKVNTNIIYQDNQSSIKLEINGKESSGQCTGHFDVKLFYIINMIQNKEVEARYCSTDSMISDYMSKPLIGTNSMKLRENILNLSITDFHPADWIQLLRLNSV